MNLPPVVSPDEWRAARHELLAKEKAATRARDALNAERRRLPMVKVDKQYTFGSDFNQDFGVTTDQGETFGLSVFLRDGDSIFRTYFTAGRGVEGLAGSTFLDLTPLGRQEEWEDSPAGWPQTPTYGWGRLHDRYGA